MYSKWIDILIKVELFNGIEKDELNNMLLCINPSIKSYKKKEYIISEGDNFTEIGIVLDGEVIVSKQTLSGDRIIMSRLNQGNIFGEIAAFACKNLPATVEAATDCTIMFFPSNKIIGVCPKMCLGHRVLIQNMLEIVSKKALLLNKKVEILSLKSIRKKISTYLLEQYFIKKNLTFEIPLKRNELAEFLLVSRPSLSRELIKMKNEGIIDFYRNSFKIMNLEELKDCL